MHCGTGPELRWLERGAGEPVVLLHGLMGRMDHWEALLEHLGDQCRPMALSLPIFDARLGEVSIPALADHVRRFLDALDIPRAVVGGNSLGGHVAIELALSCPDRVSGLILAGSSGLFERGFTRGVPRRPTAEYVRAKLEEVVHDRALVTPGWVESVRQVANTRSCALRLVRFAKAAKRDSIAERLPALRLPTLLVWGMNDVVTPPDVGRRFNALIASSQLWLLPRCGHVPMLERPEPFNRVVEHWLEATRLRARAPRAADGSGPMIARAAAPLLDWYAGRRRRELGRVWRDAVSVQEAALRRLVAAARDTEFGLAHGFGGIRSVAEYQERVPVRDYRHFHPLWQRALDGESGVTWPGRCRDWVKTSGTTSGDKVIPVTREALTSHRKGGWDALAMATERVGARHLIGRPDAVPRRQHRGPGGGRGKPRRRPVRPRRPQAAAGPARPVLARARDLGHPRVGRAARGGGSARRAAGPAADQRHAVLARAPARARGPGAAGVGAAHPAPRAVLAEPARAHPRGRELRPVRLRAGRVVVLAAGARRGLPRLRGLRRGADGGERRPHPDARLRHLLRVRAGGGPGQRARRGDTRWPMSS